MEPKHSWPWLWPFWANLDSRWMSSISISRAIFMLRYYYFIKFIKFWNNLRCRTFHVWNTRKNSLAWAERYANIISNLSNSDSTINQNHFLHCFNIFIGFWRARATRMSNITDIFSAFLKPVFFLENALKKILNIFSNFFFLFESTIVPVNNGK